MMNNVQQRNIIGIFATPLEIVNFERQLSVEEKTFICNQDKTERDINKTFQSKNTRLLDNVILKDLKT